MMRLKDFCEEYEASMDSLSVLYSRGLVSGNIYVKTKDGIFIDDKLLNRLFSRKKKVILYIQDMYYLLKEHMASAVIGYLINKDCSFSDASWNNYFNSIFKIKEEIIRYKISKKDKEVFLAFRKLERRLKKLYPSFNIGDILDKRMNDA